MILSPIQPLLYHVNRPFISRRSDVKNFAVEILSFLITESWKGLALQERFLVVTVTHFGKCSVIVNVEMKS